MCQHDALVAGAGMVDIPTDPATFFKAANQAAAGGPLTQVQMVPAGGPVPVPIVPPAGGPENVKEEPTKKQSSGDSNANESILESNEEAVTATIAPIFGP